MWYGVGIGRLSTVVYLEEVWQETFLMIRRLDMDKLAKDLQEDKEYLKHCLKPERKILSLVESYVYGEWHWWESEDTALSVARILERWGQFKERSDVIDFFEKPCKFEDKMRFIVEEM